MKIDLRIFPAEAMPMSHLGHLTEAVIKGGIAPAYSERDNPYAVRSQQIYALGKAISYTYHNFIAYERRTKILYCGLRYKLLCARLSKSNSVWCSSVYLVIWEMNIIHKWEYQLQCAEWFFKTKLSLLVEITQLLSITTPLKYIAGYSCNPSLFSKSICSLNISLDCLFFLPPFIPPTSPSCPPPLPVWCPCRQRPPETKLASLSDSGECVSAD